MKVNMMSEEENYISIHYQIFSLTRSSYTFRGINSSILNIISLLNGGQHLKERIYSCCSMESKQKITKLTPLSKNCQKTIQHDFQKLDFHKCKINTDNTGPMK